MPAPSHGERFELTTAEPDRALATFAEEVENGLGTRPKRLPSRFLYDKQGSLLFEEICKLPEYYLTRAERSILEHRADELASRFPQAASLVELGSGSAEKTRLLIEAFLSRQGRLVFAPVDISRSALEESAAALLEDYPQLEIRAVEGEYERALQHIRSDGGGPRLVLWLGSSIGNLHPSEAAAFLARVRSATGPEDRVLVGVDLRKDAEILERAYDDSRGVTARFNLNLLSRINAELGGRFDEDGFCHRAVYRKDEGRVEMHLVSCRDQKVAVEALDLELEFAEGESIHTENSYKYSLEEIDELVETAGLRCEACWLDEDARFSLNLLAPR
jgi:L-histidine N-alpha-methyltransferase